MSAVVANSVGVQLVRGDDANVAGENANFKVKNYIIYFDHNVGGNTLTAVTGGTDTLDVAVDTLINAATRNNKTVTLRAAAICQCAHDTNGSSYSGTITISSNTVSVTPRTSAWNSNANLSASYGLDRPYGLFVTVNEA